MPLQGRLALEVAELSFQFCAYSMAFFLLIHLSVSLGALKKKTKQRTQQNKNL